MTMPGRRRSDGDAVAHHGSAPLAWGPDVNYGAARDGDGLARTITVTVTATMESYSESRPFPTVNLAQRRPEHGSKGEAENEQTGARVGYLV
ncbi:hypothetical protein BTUL_0255g00120 [Botrytis tulipae]|uniref:Uncharacterized protein n=1 Tax=Botrytis tulipae TaxID=87230 RepID=A0A4Z1E6D1_9HELO|nr:hypothetical protein BTUL_0255g00120 [Botrytis tulipae]